VGPLSRTGKPLAGRVVGVYGSGGAPWHHLAFAAVHGAEARVVRAEDIAAGRLGEVDVLVFPGGGATAMGGLLAPLEESGATAVREWVAGGGTYLSSCAGSVLPLALDGEADAALPVARRLRMVDARLANTGDATLGGLSSPGVGRIEVRLDPTHRFCAGLPERLELMHYNGPLFDTSGTAPGLLSFAWPDGSTAAFTPAEGFLPPVDPRASSTTLERCVDAGAATGLEAVHGAGRVVLFGSHPEFGLGPLCLGWGEGSGLLLAAMAVEGAGCGTGGRHSPAAASGTAWAVRRGKPSTTAQELVAEVTASLLRAAERFEELASRDPGTWVDEGFAPSFHGLSARDAWRSQAFAAAVAARAAASGIGRIAGALNDGDIRWLDDEPRQGQDFGAMGLSQLLRAVHRQLDATDEALHRPARKPAHAYDLFDTHPFHLAVGSYLSAAGLSAAALLLVALLLARQRRSDPSIDALLWREKLNGEEECSLR
jgi:hypothetical protein